MKKMRKLLAVILTFAMVMGLSVTTFAATKDTATITVNDAKDATLTYAQVIKADQKTVTGWNFVNDKVADAYKAAFGVTDAQDAIKAMIPAENVNATKLGVAQANAAGAVTFAAMSNPQTVNAAGVYLVKAVEAGYTYNLMAAYIGFGEVKIDENNSYDYPSLVDATLTAKKSIIEVNKSVDDEDNVTKTGAVLTYTVKTNVPFINPTDTDKTFWVYDELTGAKYTEKNAATITLAGVSVKENYTFNYSDNDTKFAIDLSGMIDDANSNAGKEVKITYKVVVTSENDKITNKATAGHKDGDDYGSKTVETFEGNITLTKTNENGTETLAGAGFEVRKGNADGKEEKALTFVKLTDGVYKYDPAGKVTEVVTAANGTVKVQGLDVGTYYFKEITAPEGYSINATDAVAELKLAEGTTSASAALTASTSMADTRLNALPSTGGIGTTIFTIGGCAIMIAAAYMFFVSRRKEEQ